MGYSNYQVGSNHILFKLAGRRSRGRGGGGQVPGAGRFSPDFVMWQNFKHLITCITMYENVFFASTAGLL